MSFLKKLFRKGEDLLLSDDELLDTGVCPNCWGKQAYADEFVNFTEDQTKANVNHDKQHQKAFIQQFMETNVTGIQLKRDGSELTCSRCKVKHKR